MAETEPRRGLPKIGGLHAGSRSTRRPRPQSPHALRGRGVVGGVEPAKVEIEVAVRQRTPRPTPTRS